MLAFIITVLFILYVRCLLDDWKYKAAKKMEQLNKQPRLPKHYFKSK